MRVKVSRSPSLLSPKAGGSGTGKSVTLKADTQAEAERWQTSIGTHSAWINWQSQSDNRTKRRLISNFVSVGVLNTPSFDAMPLPPPESALPWTYDASLFKQCYAEASAPNTLLEVLQPLNAMILLFAQVCDIPNHEAVAEAFYRQHENEIFEYREAHKEVHHVCQRLWTSTLRLQNTDTSGNDDPAYASTYLNTDSASASAAASAAAPTSLPAEMRIELCSIINRTLQKDGALNADVSPTQRRKLLQHVAVLCRGINTIRATGSDHADELVRAGSMYIGKADIPFPPDGVTWRGGGFREEHKSFFVKGLKFRAPCYLATSFSLETAEEFRRLAASKGFDTVMWRIEVDPEGATNPNRRCFQVNYVRQTVLGLPDEQEFLFTQFAPFQVKDVSWSDNPRDEPHRITLYALQDGRKEREDLPLSPWN